MRFGSLCSGIEAASVAFRPLGWEAAWFAEIEAFPSAVLAHHHPEVPNHGDMTAIAEKILAGEIEAPDLICGGTPCQAFSIAGLRNSLDDDRGNLTLQFIKICDANDTVRRAAGREESWILYENVPGILSTHDNAFGAFLGGLVGGDSAIPKPEDGWPGSGVVDGPTRVAAWRTLNAEHFGLAQRRKRVFVLAKGGAGRWAAADALLPIIKGSGWHPAPSRGERQGVAPTISARPTGGGGLGADFDCDGGLIPQVTRPLTAAMGTKWNGNGDLESSLITSKWPADIAPTLNASFGDKQGLEDQHALNGAGLFVPVAFTQNQRDEVREQDVAGALSAEGGTHQTTYIAFDPAQITSKTNRSNPQPGDPIHTLRQGEPPMLVRMREGKEGGGKGPLVSKDQSPTLATANDQVLAFEPGSIARNAGPAGESPQAPTLRSSMGDNQPAIRLGMQVRRLTPKECCRLQGFPDTYLDITYKGKPAADGPKYKAIGNSWAVPVVNWIGRRIAMVDEILSRRS